MTNSMDLFVDHNGVVPVAMMPGAGAAPVLVVTAPRLLAI